MPRESSINQAEKDSFEIEKFIFHIILKENSFAPTYLDEVELSSEQIDFFKKRFAEIAEGTQCEFVDKEKSTFYKSCTTLLFNSDENFVKISKELAYAFHQQHNKTTNDGVFIISIVKVAKTRKLIFLIKLDHIKVYKYDLKDKKALLEEIKNTFVEDKKIIQKSALIDLSDHFVWDVLAMERGTTLRDYFKSFLTVKERETPFTLTQKSISSVNQWAILNKDNLDPTQEISSYKARAVQYLKSATLFKAEDFIELVTYDLNADRKNNLKITLNEFLIEKGISGNFVPNQKATENIKKNVRKTAEGVKVEWIGDAKDVNVEIPDKKSSDGRYHILIKTSRIDYIDN